VPTATPTSIPEATSILSSIFSAAPTDLYDNIIELVANDFSPGNLGQVETTYSAGCNSMTNSNPRNPSDTIYPKKSSQDAPYSLTEQQLREVIYIPSTFTYGQIPPLVMVPGTGSTGCLTFGANFIPQFTGSSFADPVWLNIPGFLLGDAQVNAEYVAYAINYISGISNNVNVSVIAWSQGNLDTQWALKYWPSTRNITSDFISISPDFHGTELAYITCPEFPKLPCAPSVIQQAYNSNFVTTIRENGGDSAYVPTTTIYSGFYDEIVEPQQGTGASAYINDARNVGVTNNEAQIVCNGQLAGGFYTHEGMLYNPLAYALAVDALQNPGPGEPSRLNLPSVCSEIVSPGLSLADVLATEGNIPVAGAAILLYTPKVLTEPPIMAYAA